MRRLLALLAICIAVFAAAWVAHRLIVPDIVPVAFAEGPQSLWGLETAFLLQSIQNLAATCAAIVLVVIIGRQALRARWHRDNQP